MGRIFSSSYNYEQIAIIQLPKLEVCSLLPRLNDYTLHTYVLLRLKVQSSISTLKKVIMPAFLPGHLSKPGPWKVEEILHQGPVPFATYVQANLKN
jgi:hypothetical protein